MTITVLFTGVCFPNTSSGSYTFRKVGTYTVRKVVIYTVRISIYSSDRQACKPFQTQPEKKSMTKDIQLHDII